MASPDTKPDCMTSPDIKSNSMIGTDIIIKPPESSEMCEEITEFVVVATTTNSVISTYSTLDEGDFIFISYKREAYGRPEAQGMLYCIYYELNQCPPSVFSPTPF